MKAEFLIPQDARVRDALRQLDVAESKVLFVVDDDEALVGALSDGDIRRWILSGGDLDGRVTSVCSHDPTFVTGQPDREEVRRTMLAKNITGIPVLDARRRVREVLLWDQVFGDEAAAPTQRPIDLPVVIMAGGVGTRLSPFSSVLPKPLIPLGGKTVIELIMDAFTAYGVQEFFLSVNHKSRIIKSFFEELEPPFAVHFLYEEKPLGTAGGLRGLVGRVDGDLIVTNCDVIVRADYHDLVRHHQQQANDVTLVVSLKNFTIPYGVCEIENGGTLRTLREKPNLDYLANTGLYILKPGVLDAIPEGEAFHATDLIAKTQAQGGRVGVFPIGSDAWIDTGEWSEYRAAVAQLSADRRRAAR